MPIERPKFKSEYRRLKEGELGARQNRKGYLRQRRRELERAGLKQGKEITMEKADAFFKKRYGVEYRTQLLHLFGDKTLYPGNTHISEFRELLETAIKSKERTLFLFPQTGQMFTHYFMRGVIEELRKQGITNLSARTIVTPKAVSAPFRLINNRLIEQATKIHGSTNPKRIVLVDLIDSGVTRERLKLAFTGYDIKFDTLEFAEHQPLEKHFLSPGDFIDKSYFFNSIFSNSENSLKLSLRYNINPKTIREMLFFMGRFFTHTHLNK